MSRQARLPPRCPLPKKPLSHQIHDGILTPQSNFNSSLSHQHHRSSSQSFTSEEQPEWLHDLLSEPDSIPKGISHRRSASDSATFLDSFAKLSGSLKPKEDEESSVGNYERYSGLEAGCIYGPNSPRQKGSSTFMENAIVSALSEYVTQYRLQYGDCNGRVSGVMNTNSKVDACNSAGELNPETKPVKRHSGQRSRVRKLQYIAELEKSVNDWQNLHLELATKVTTMLQQRAALSLENSKLKQQLIRLQQDKLNMEGQYRSLKQEAERMKMGLAGAPKSTVGTYFGSNPATEAETSWSWHMLDMGKLSLN